jgi:hypothetical protein
MTAKELREQITDEVQREFSINAEGWKLEGVYTRTVGNKTVQAVPSAHDTKRLRNAVIEARLSARQLESLLSDSQKEVAKAEKGWTEERNHAEDSELQLFGISRKLNIEGSIKNWQTSIYKAIADLQKQLSEAYEAIREDWPIWIGQTPLAYSCSRCRAFGETKENFPHKPTCIVLTAQKARDGK